MRVTILCPTHNHGRLIHLALHSVLQQSHQDFELFVIGDGVTPETREAVKEILQWDSRIQFVDREKSPRHGELYRHDLLLHRATGEMVCYMADDDLWMPHHLHLMNDVLLHHQVAHSRHLHVIQEGIMGSSFVNWSAPAWREWTVSPPPKNGVGLSQAGHRLDFYKTLPYGWRTTPVGEWSDHYMWKQMLQMPGIRAASTCEPSVIQFPSSMRRDMTLDERYREMQEWEARIVSDSRSVRDNLPAGIAGWEAAEISGQLQTELFQLHDEWRRSMKLKRMEIEKLRHREQELKQRLDEARKKAEAWKQQYLKVPRWMRNLAKHLK